jgi:hypothetical protein
MAYRDRESVQPGGPGSESDEHGNKSSPTSASYSTGGSSRSSNDRGPPPPPPSGGGAGGFSGGSGSGSGSGSSGRSGPLMRDEELFFSLPRSNRPPSRSRTVDPGGPSSDLGGGSMQTALGWTLPETRRASDSSRRQSSITPEEQTWLDATDKLSIHSSSDPYTALPPPVLSSATAGYVSSSSATVVGGSSPSQTRKGKGKYRPSEESSRKLWESDEDDASQPAAGGENKGGLLGGLLSSIGLAGIWGGTAGTRDDES